MSASIKLIHGKSYTISFKRTTVEYIYKHDDFYEVKRKKDKEFVWILFKELETHMRMMAGFPKDFEGIKIVEILNNNEK